MRTTIKYKSFNDLRDVRQSGIAADDREFLVVSHDALRPTYLLPTEDRKGAWWTPFAEDAQVYTFDGALAQVAALVERKTKVFEEQVGRPAGQFMKETFDSYKIINANEA